MICISGISFCFCCSVPLAGARIAALEEQLAAKTAECTSLTVTRDTERSAWAVEREVHISDNALLRSKLEEKDRSKTEVEEAAQSAASSQQQQELAQQQVRKTRLS